MAAKYYARLDSLGWPIPGTMMVTSGDIPVGNVEIPASEASSTTMHPQGFRYFVGKDSNGNIIPNSLIVTKKRPNRPCYEFRPAAKIPSGPALIMTFETIPVADPTVVSSWNTKFGSSSFTQVYVSGNEVRLYGSSTFVLGSALLNSTLISFDDQAGFVTSTTGSYPFAANRYLNFVNLTACTTIGAGYVFMGSGDLATSVTLKFPVCTNMGGTAGDNNVFGSSFGGKPIALTVKASLMTINAGAPDGDIAVLQAGNTVTVTTV